ncbi:CBS domain-containing protein [Clostridium cibarium]|uniref:CBS domain-containing protein n=1 Tax=Clostridium cibarium TaxID=2762247 RepID=A0ABR8PZ00_9CLOT|nr:CBS domain-containing protein [Clostridium cibarium]MBD7913396.1 CBS domain-containing protein [Clostridium cibarium]
MEIKSIIKSENYTVKENDTIDKVLEMMDKLHINGIPVVNDSDNLVGMVVKADIYRFMITPGHYDSCPVEWVMSKSVIYAEAQDDVFSIAERLRKNNINSMPVVDNGEVIGTISVEDLVDYFMKSK